MEATRLIFLQTLKNKRKVSGMKIAMCVLESYMILRRQLRYKNKIELDSHTIKKKKTTHEIENQTFCAKWSIQVQPLLNSNISAPSGGQKKVLYYRETL